MDTRHSQYKPISTTEFRVVHLLPGTFDDEIQCVLETRSSGIKTRYEALSYQWGDDSVTNPIRIAHLDSSSRQVHPPNPRATTWPISTVRKALDTVHTTAKKHDLGIRLLSWCIGTYLFWTRISQFPLEPGPAVAWLVPRKPYLFFVSAVCGLAPLDILFKVTKLVIEVGRTKPWTLAYHFRLKSGERLDFETLQVPTNLALALRYLRLEKTSRTLWIDALCINQADEDEKRMQIQRMDWVYANASTVVVWLGGYHGIMDPTDCEEGGGCAHRHQIQAAFDLFRSLSGSRLLVPSYFKPDKQTQYREARPGLRDLYKRGWWERLWVIQEVALATGRVRIQCGHNTVDFDDFRSAQCTILWDHTGDVEMETDSKPVERLTATIKAFSHSSYHELEGPLQQLIVTGISKATISLGGRGPHNNELQFHRQPFAERLQRILLKTSGQFRCRDDRDRLYAVLGIAGGAKSGQVTILADFVRYMSSFPVVIVLSNALNPLLDVSDSLYFKSAVYGLGFAHSFWACFYDSNAKHWTISRPEYVVTGYREVIDAVTGGQGGRSSRVEFFTALARYLGNKTKSLAFLDAATCGKDKDGGMPSWVPNWTREVGSPTYDFSIRVKKDPASDRFGFTDDGKALWISGRPKGTVHVVRTVADSDVSRPDGVQGLFENWLSLPREGKEAARETWKLIAAAMMEMSLTPEQEEGRKELVSLSTRLIKTLLDLGGFFLKQGGPTLVYSFDKGAREMGFLKAGEAAKGDRIVFVPGCFHHLVLRRLEPPRAADMRWKLVGLVAMGTSLKAGGAGGGCSKSEWARLMMNGEVFKYIIV